MAVIQIKKYKNVKDENGNKMQVPKTKEEWNKDTCNGTKTWYFYERYKLNEKPKQYCSGVYALKREAEEENRIFLNDPIEYIKTHSKRAKLDIKETTETTEITSSKNLNEYYNDFFKYELRRIKEVTVYAHKKIWDKHIAIKLGDLTPKQLNLSVVQNWHEYIDSKINKKTGLEYAISSKKNFHSTLSEFMQFLFKRGLIEMNYCKIIGSFERLNVNKNQKKKIKYQTLEEYNRFMEIVDDEFWLTFFNFTFWHGPRKGEQRALKIKDIDLEHNAIYFHSTFSRNSHGSEIIGPIKNGKERTTYLAEQSKPYIEKLINFYKQMNGYSEDWFLFGGPVNTNKNRIERAFHKYYKSLQEKYPNEIINVLTHHEFGRHSHASYLLFLGGGRIDIYEIIANRLGDTTDVIRETYAHPYEDINNDKSKELLKKALNC